MDDARFDALTKRFASGLSRRGTLRGLVGLIAGGAAGVVGLRGKGGVAATSCTSRCERLPAGSARDQCLAACAAADNARATAEAQAAQARADAANARATAEAEAANARATAQAQAAEARAQADALRACRGDTSRICGSGVDVACCAPDEICDSGTCIPGLGCVEVGGICSADGDCCASTRCIQGICAVPTCGSSNCSGCCDSNDNCWENAGRELCGNGGVACTVCGPNQVCSFDGSICGDVCDGRYCPTGHCCDGVECCGDAVCCGGTCCPDAGYGCCGDTCVQFNTTDNCGACDNTCAPTQVCYQQTCCTLATCDGRCGTIDDGCGGTIDCPASCDTSQCLTCNEPAGTCDSTCTGTQVCHNASCCTPATCPAGQCGSFDDGCGGMTQCGDCGAGEVCVNNGCFRTTAANCDGCTCERHEECCFCSNGWDGTIHHLCVRDTSDSETYDCPHGNADCPRGWVCYTPGNGPTCSPPC